ncbi:MAG: phytoene/squalene synthase family protein, partial [Alphaproteobacteria bacterium]
MVKGSRQSYCAEQVRRLDRDRYRCTLFAPAGARDGLFALYAFNIEIARIRESVSEPMLGEIRLQWWREAVDGIYRESPPQQEVVRALAPIVAEAGLTRALFDRLLEGRTFDLDDEPPRTLAALERYAEETSATLTLLTLEVLGVKDEAAQEAGFHVGIAWALAGLLRAVPFHARARRLYLPRESLEAAGLSPEDVFGLRFSLPLGRVTAEVAGCAAGHLTAARSLARKVPRRALSALLPAALAESDLKRLRRHRYNPFAPALAEGGLGRQLRLLV